MEVRGELKRADSLLLRGCWGLNSGTQLGGKYFQLLSHLTGPVSSFLLKNM